MTPPRIIRFNGVDYYDPGIPRARIDPMAVLVGLTVALCANAIGSVLIDANRPNR